MTSSAASCAPRPSSRRAPISPPEPSPAKELIAAEDAAIADLVEKEKQAGLKAVTDGEFRRAMWHLDFLEGLQTSSTSMPKRGR